MKYDIIGDVHGYAHRFIVLLEKLGYACIDGVWQHSERILISVGDIIDRGPEQKLIVDILKTMQTHGKAIVLMGNHEFYAIAWHQTDKNGQPWRPHSPKNYKEHEAFLAQVADDKQWYLETIAWLKTLPLFIDRPDLRCVHAAWDDKHIACLKQYTDECGRILENFWQQPEQFGAPFFKSLEYTLNGRKVSLPEGCSFIDSGGKTRTKARLKWWDVPAQNATYRNSCTSVPNLSELPDVALSLDDKPTIASKVPIFFGHYWMQGQPVLLKANIACLDWSVVVEDGVLAAYRFDGEKELAPEKLLWV